MTYAVAAGVVYLVFALGLRSGRKYERGRAIEIMDEVYDMVPQDSRSVALMSMRVGWQHRLESPASKRGPT